MRAQKYPLNEYLLLYFFICYFVNLVLEGLNWNKNTRVRKYFSEKKKKNRKRSKTFCPRSGYKKKKFFDRENCGWKNLNIKNFKNKRWNERWILGGKRNRNFFCIRKLGRIFINGKKGWSGERVRKKEKQIEDEWKMSISC